MVLTSSVFIDITIGRYVVYAVHCFSNVIGNALQLLVIMNQALTDM